MCRHVIVIVTYNRAEKLKECLHHIEEQSCPYDMIVVVNNASTDETGAVLYGKQTDSRYHIFTEEKNTGGAGGFERGMKEAYLLGAEWITVIDDDAMLEKNFLQSIDHMIALDPNPHLCYAGVPKTNGLRIGHRRRVAGKIIKKEVPVPAEEYEKAVFSCQIGSFCGLVLHRSIIENYGLPDPSFFLWYDDTEYCLRFSGKYPILNVNSAVIDHQAEGYRESGISWKEYYNIRNRICMARRHYGFITALFITLKKVIRCMRDGLFLCVRGRIRESKALFKMYCTGIVDGWGGHMGLHEKYRPGYKTVP